MDISLLVGILVGLITIFGAFAAIVAGFVRADAKSKQNTTDINDLYDTISKHAGDRSIHHDEGELNRRFSEMNSTMSEIKGEIVRLTAMLTSYIMGEQKK